MIVKENLLMTKLDPKKIYEQAKKNISGKIYDEKKHCLMVLEIIGNGGSVAEFCVEALISDSTYYNWRRLHPIFDECSRIAVNFAQMLWEREGESNADNPDFNWRFWEGIGTSRFFYNKQGRVRINLDEEADPHVQYQQLIKQAKEGDLSASEIKQLMESVNIGIRAFESFKLQEQVDKMQQDLKKMNLENGNNIIPIKGIAETNQNTAPDTVC
jgi:DNA-binding transcriptional MerR regulator